MTVGTGADDALCEVAEDLRNQLRQSIIRELRLREKQAESWRRITDLECDLADARIALEELHRELTDTRRLAVR